MNLSFLFEPFNLAFTFCLVLAVLNMGAKILLVILRILRRADYLKPIAVEKSESKTELYLKNLSEDASLSYDFSNIPKKSFFRYFFHLNNVSGFVVWNLHLFSFGLAGLIISSELLKIHTNVTVVSVILSISASVSVSIVISKGLLYLFSVLFPKYDANNFPKSGLVGYSAWILRRKRNLYLCEVFEPCGQNFKVEVALPVTENPPKWRTPVILTKFIPENKTFEGNYISVEKAVKIFEDKEKEVFSYLREQEIIESIKKDNEADDE